MSEATANKVENQSDAKSVAKAADTASNTKADLSNSIQDMMKEAAGKATSPVESAAADGAGKLGNEISNQVGKEAAGGETSGQIGKAIENMGKNKIADGISNSHEGQKQIDKSGVLEQLQKGGMAMGEIGKIKMPVTDEDRKEAKEALEKGISGLVPEGDRKAQLALQNAIIDGDMGKFKEAVKSLGNDPEKLAKMVKEVNDQLNRNEKFGGVELSMDSKGNVLLYGEKGSTAVSVNPKTGEATLRAVETQNDGSVVLKDGEIINRKADDVMKQLGDQATRSVTEYPFINKPPFHLPPDGGFPPFHPKPRIEEKPRWNDKPTWDDKPNLKDKIEKGHIDFTPLKGFENKKTDDK